jgi:hypothetical protein
VGRAVLAAIQSFFFSSHPKLFTKSMLKAARPLLVRSYACDNFVGHCFSPFLFRHVISSPTSPLDFPSRHRA